MHNPVGGGGGTAGVAVVKMARMEKRSVENRCWESLFMCIILLHAEA